MGKIQLSSNKASDEQELQSLIKQTLNVTSKNDIELSDKEVDFERKAEKLSIVEFPRIFPRKATIGFMVRAIDGGNHQVVEYIRMALSANATASINNMVALLIDFDNLDEASQSRIDCLDWLCRKNRIQPIRFLDYLESGIIAFHNKVTSAIIAAKKPALASKIFEAAHAEGNKANANKRLAAEIAGLTSKEPMVTIDQSKKVTINDNRKVLSFTEFAKQQDSNQKLLEEKDYVDGEIVEDESQ